MLPPPRDEPGPDSPGLRNGAREGTQAAGSAGLIAAVTLQPYRLYGWFKPLAEAPIYLAKDWRILNQLVDRTSRRADEGAVRSLIPCRLATAN